MNQLSVAIITSARPRHWIKNIALFAPLFFTGNIFDLPKLCLALAGAIAFSLLSSSSYILNDIVDQAADRTHPYKRFRPLARRVLSVTTAYKAVLLFLILGMTISMLIGWQFFAVASLFIILHYLHIISFRKMAIIDILSISLGYMLRVYAGAAATQINISIWLGLAILCLSLLFAMGKRRAEYAILSAQGKPKEKEFVRYSERLLDRYVAMFATATFITYTYYTFLADSTAVGFIPLGGEGLFDTSSRKWMMVTTPFVLYGVMRYVQLIYEGKSGQPLDKMLTGDWRLFATIIAWGAATFIVVYGIGR